MNPNLLNQLLQALPLYSEEDDLREEIPEAALQELLPGEAGAATLMVVRRLFESCALLDPRLLSRDVWAFISFPAALAGHSLLQVLATPKGALFEPDYWRQGNPDVEGQRKLLKQIETRRVKFHPMGSASPVRYVYVAWGLIRLGGRFLMHHREDESRPDVKNYVLPGGRVKPGDLSIVSQTVKGLRQMHASRSGLMMDALPKTLTRELWEETGLSSGEDYQASLREELQPDCRVEGAGNKHAYTEYVIALYDVSLTPAGEIKLLEKIDTAPETLVWFNVDDLLSPVGRADGKGAFIDALKAHYGKDLGEFLEKVPSSSTFPYRFSERSQAVEFPICSEQPVRIGETGKEKPFELALPVMETAFLTMAALHAKGIEMHVQACHVRLLPGGWIKAESDLAHETMKQLAAILGASAMTLLEIIREDFCRVTVNPEILFFNDTAYRYRLSQDGERKGFLEITCSLPATVFFDEVNKTLALPLKSSMLNSLHDIAAGSVGSGDLEKYGYSDETLKKNFKEMLDEKTRPLGLRKFVRQSSKSYQIAVRPQES